MKRVTVLLSKTALTPLIILAAVLSTAQVAVARGGGAALTDAGYVAAPMEDPVPEGVAAEDWTGIQAAYEASRYAAYPVEDGYQARNPGQQWRTHFDGRGFSIKPDSGDWTCGLQLESYGFAGSEKEVTGTAPLSAESGRVAYMWNGTLEEWYINDTRGLEHGYIVHQRPVQGGGGTLTFTLAVRGTLHPEVTADRRGVRFQDAGGAAMLTYAGLHVLDADGREMEASFHSDDDNLCLFIDERGARYPLTIDPIVQQAYLKASNADSEDNFGHSVSVSGDTVVIGAASEDSSATGVNGDQSDNSALSAGAAYVFVRSGTSWTQEAYLKASNTEADDFFGLSVAVSIDTVVVGARDEDSNATSTLR